MTGLPSLILFARAPAFGRVKTRLASTIGAAGALALYRAFLEDASRLYAAGDWSPVLAAEPDPEEESFVAMFPPPWRREAQGEGDLGRRLTAAFRREFDRGAPAAIAVGSDHPSLGPRRLAQALALVTGGSSAAAIPAEDGGYCAIAFAAGAPYEEAFRDIAWSTSRVLDQTRSRLAGLQAPLALLEPAYDVDRAEDLARLRRDVASRDPAQPDFPLATARVLEEFA